MEHGQAGKTCIITGANTGIGFNAAQKMAAKGFTTILACRNADKATAAVAAIQRQVELADVRFLTLDLASLASIRQFVTEFQQLGLGLDVLVCNAGMYLFFKSRKKVPYRTVEGFEPTVGINHLGHFLLVNLLLDDLKRAPAARVVMTTSSVHDPLSWDGKRANWFPEIDFAKCFDGTHLSDSLSGQAFDGWEAYAKSKLCNLLFTYALRRRIAGSGVTANAFHPGLILSTGIFGLTGVSQFFFARILPPLVRLLLPGRIVTETRQGTAPFLWRQTPVWKAKAAYIFKACPTKKSLRLCRALPKATTKPSRKGSGRLVRS